MKTDSKISDYQISNFPQPRIAALDVVELGRKKHQIKALLELDVTDSRAAIKEYRRKTGVKLSFTAWLIKSISAAIEEVQSAHAYLLTKRKSVIFNDINIALVVERIYDGQPVPLPYVIRRCNEKSLLHIHDEIQHAKTQDISQEDVVLGDRQYRLATKLYFILPGFLRRTMWRFVLKRPNIAKNGMGSVMLTSIGMMGRMNGWFIHSSIHPLSFGVSSIIQKPWVVDGAVKVREILNITVLMDHDVMDGAPMAQFIERLSQNIESAAGLEDYLPKKQSPTVSTER
jgi:hypothetical protein